VSTATGPAPTSPIAFPSRLHDERTAASLGVALGVGFAVCFATGVLSHLIQGPPGWFSWPPRPAGLYRITQGTHVVTGFALIPVTLAKLWVTYPRLLQWPPVRGAAHALERLALVPLVGGALFLLVSGTLNVARWYPWSFFFPRTHYWAAWVTAGALAVHVGVTWAVVRRTLARGAEPPALLVEPPAHRAEPEAGADASSAGPVSAGPVSVGAAPAGAAPARPAAARAGERRAFLGAVAATAGLVALGAAGGTVAWTSPLSAFAQRRPGQGPQGLPVNKSAVAAGVVDAARDLGWRLVVEGDVERTLHLSLAELRAFDQHEATLPIACVEGWSQSARWQGVRLRDLLARAGARPGADVAVESLQEGGLYRASTVDAAQAGDPDTLIALRLDGEELGLDHGYPARLIGPNRPGVQQTKWVGRLVVS
jgi:DMSO/TMAO reductase YedYZ molybdopterin-dependent catalytic subunit